MYVAVLVFLAQVIRFVVLALSVSRLEFVTDGLLLGVCVCVRARARVWKTDTKSERCVYFKVENHGEEGQLSLAVVGGLFP